MANPLRLVTIGTSSITERLLEAAQEVEGLAYVGTMSRDASKAAAFTQAHGGTKSYTSVAQIAEDAEVDAIYIGSPNECHYSQAIELIRAGKNVLVEKPICANRFEVQQLFAAANLHHIISTEAMRPLHDPNWAKIAAQIPKLGTLRRATLRFGKYSSRYDNLRSGQQTNIFDTRMASGALMDIGIYPIEVMCALFGAPKEVKAAPVMLAKEYEPLTHGPLDGAGSAICTYGSHRDFPGLVVEIAYSKITNDYLPSQFEGELGTLTIDSPHTPTKATLTLRGANGAVDTVEEIELTPVPNTMVHELRDFVAMCAGEKINTMWGDDLDIRAAFTHFDNASLDALAVTDEIRRQAGIEFESDYHRG